MAKIKFGMMMTDARGKLGGQVFSKNRSGAYVRTKVTPVNPRTTDQQFNRSLLGTFSTVWSNLTENQRNAWNSAVDQWQKTNVFGDLQKPTGKNLFTGLNKVRAQLFPALPLLTLPPAKAEFPSVEIVSITFDASTGVATAQLTVGAFEGSTYQVRATPPVSPGTTYVNNLLRNIGQSFIASGTNQITFGPAYIAKFGQPSTGDKIFFEITPVVETGQKSVPSMASTQVVE
jgi:hypothetical protein